MIAYDQIELFKETLDELSSFQNEVEEYRSGGPLDKVSLGKLEEYFKAGHVYHSAGIEGNRLTLQETVLVLKEGIDISDKPLKDSIEVRRLGQAFDYLKELTSEHGGIRETDIRSLHHLLVGEEPELSPGEYRKVGVVISGSEHRPPEPLAVPGLMSALVEWINLNIERDPIVIAAVAHHELAAIHPFSDGNGRTARLLMNLILMKRGFPIGNIKRDRRPHYYECLSFADVGIYDPLIRVVKEACSELFAEYVRIREETKRTQAWADRWGAKEADTLRRRETREMELWQARMRQVSLEFQKTAELLNDTFELLDIEFYDFKNEVDFDKYERLMDRGFIERANAFSITFRDRRTSPAVQERFTFRYFRPIYFPDRRAIPLELNHLDREENKYIRVAESLCADRVRLRHLYFSSEGKLIARLCEPGKSAEKSLDLSSATAAAQMFFDDVLQNVLVLTR